MSGLNPRSPSEPGEPTPGYEAVLARAWARAVVASKERRPGLGGVTAAARVAIDVDIPTTSASRVRTAGKRVLRNAQRWYLRYLADQVSRMGQAMADGLENLDARIQTIEDEWTASADDLDAELLTSVAEPLPERSLELCQGLVAGTEGRVLHMDAGHGDLVELLLGIGLDAYGVEPGLAVPAGRSDLEIWRVDPLDHLMGLLPGSLGALVLSGIVDRLRPEMVPKVLDVAWSALVPDGRLVLIARDPRSWLSGTSGLRADLAPGRPLRPATWTHLLVERGASDLTQRPIQTAPGEAFVRDVELGTGPFEGATAQMLGEALFPPSHHVISARR